MICFNFIHNLFIIIVFITINSTYFKVFAFEDEYPIVVTENGLIRGKKSQTLFDEKIYYSFKGIPYAEPPINKLRFKAPRKLKPTKTYDVFDAFEFGNVCLQPNGFLNFDKTKPEWLGDENCLFLNIYTPDPTPDADLAVIFFIHGGGFAEGAGDMYGPDFLINENVILVTINYRLGPFGFMSLHDENYSGNMGLKDQLLALKWINNNIKNFGGNNKLITIVGQSAGGASTHYHIISPESRGLFKRAIPMSGAALNAWAYSPMVHHMFHMYEFAKALKTPVENVTDLIKFLKTANAITILKYNADNLRSPNTARLSQPVITWAPLVELSFVKQPFLTEKIENTLMDSEFSSNVDTMFGFTSHELLFMSIDVITDPQLLEPFNSNFDMELPLRGGAEAYRKYTAHEYKISKSIRDLYFGKSGKVSAESTLNYIQLWSDLCITFAIDLSVKIQSLKSTGKTYYYRFSVDGELNFFKKYFNVTFPGASHGDELCYIFRCNFIPSVDMYKNIEKDSVEMKAIKNMSKLWANFAKYGDPTSTMKDSVVHKPIDGENINYLDIRNDELVLDVHPRKKYMQFWNNFYTKTKHNLFINERKDEL